MAKKKYKYAGNRDSSNTTKTLTSEGREYYIGDEIPLSAAKRDVLSKYFILEDAEGREFGEGEVPPTAIPPDEAPTAGESTIMQSAPDSGPSLAKGRAGPKQDS